MKETRIFIINIWSPEVHLPFKRGVKALRNENGRKKKKKELYNIIEKKEKGGQQQNK